MNVLENATLRRLLILIVTTVLLAVEKKLGLEIDPTTKGEIAAVVVAYLLASNAKEAAVEKAKAAAGTASEAVTTPEQALKVMGPQP